MVLSGHKLRCVCLVRMYMYGEILMKIRVVTPNSTSFGRGGRDATREGVWLLDDRI